jgi:NarL family two-component system response regulator LiaR
MADKNKLTKRQGDIYRLAVKGYLNSKIADKLNISEPTVKFHMTSILRKYGVTNRKDLIVQFYKGFAKSLD